MATVTQKMRLRKVWADERSYATTLLTAFLDVYGADGLQWRPETIYEEIKDDFRVAMKDGPFSRLMAGIAILTTDRFYTSLPEFIHLCNVLSGDSYNPRMWDPAELDEVTWGVVEATIIYPLDQGESYSPEIIGYIKMLMELTGVAFPPKALVTFTPGLAREIRDLDVNFELGGPELSEAIAQVQSLKAAEVDAIVLQKLDELISQLESLELDSGTTKGIREILLKGTEPNELHSESPSLY